MTALQVDPVCAAIRLVPVWVCLAAHCANGRWPTQAEAFNRVVRYGFSVETFRRRPGVLLTHIFVHANDAHLCGNVASLTAVLMEFGGDSMRGNVEEDDVAMSLLRTVGSFVVLITGGIVGGIGGQLLFLDVQRMCRRRQWPTLSRLQAMVCPKEEAPLAEFCACVRGWFDKLAHKLEKRRAESIFMCGSSAGVFALAGFNASYYTRWASVVTLLLPELMKVACTLLETPPPITGLPWMPAMGELVGHAAHVGGFVIGVGMGAMWRWCTNRRKKGGGGTRRRRGCIGRSGE